MWSKRYFGGFQPQTPQNKKIAMAANKREKYPKTKEKRRFERISFLSE